MTNDPPAVVLAVDHRGAMARGQPGETALDRCRSAALDVLADRRRRSVPVGLVTVGDAGITDWQPPAATTTCYGAVEQRLRTLAPTTLEDAMGGAPPSGGRPGIDERRAGWVLRGDDSPYATTIRTFLQSSPDDRRRLEADELYEAVRYAVRHAPDRASVVLFVDDSNPTELTAAVARVVDDGGEAEVYLAPRAVFEPRDLADAPAIYREYRSFDRLRRDLADHGHVVVHEVAPS